MSYKPSILGDSIVANSAQLKKTVQKYIDLEIIEISELPALKIYGLDYFDFVATQNTSKFSVTGRGTDRDPDVAIAKAFMESAERAQMVLHQFKNSNGFASGFDLQMATMNSLAELFERHLFFWHYFTGAPFIETSDLSVVDEDFLIGLMSRGVKIRVFQSPIEIDGLSMAMCVLDGRTSNNPFGIICGTSAGSDYRKCVEKAVLEAARYFVWVTEKDIHGISINEFLGIKKPSVDDHGRLGLDLTYGNNFIKNISIFQESIRKFSSRDLFPSLETKIISEMCYLGEPIYTCRSYAQECIGLELGLFQLGAQTRINLQKFGETVNILHKGVCDDPHPYR